MTKGRGIRLSRGQKCPMCTPMVKCPAHAARLCPDCGLPGRHTCDAPLIRAGQMRAIDCDDCGATPGFVCVVPAGPYKGLATSFHPSRVRATEPQKIGSDA